MHRADKEKDFTERILKGASAGEYVDMQNGAMIDDSIDLDYSLNWTNFRQVNLSIINNGVNLDLQTQLN